MKIDGFHVDTFRMNRLARGALATVLLSALMAAMAPAAEARPAADARPVPPRTDVDPAARAATLRATVAQRTRAVRAAEARRDDWQRRLDETLTLEEAAQARTDHLSNVAAQAAARYAKSRTRLAKFAAEAYKDGPSVTPLTQLLSSDSAADYAYRHEIVSRVGDQQRDILARAKHDRVAAKVAADEARDQRNRLHELVQTLQQDLPAREEAVMSSTATRDQAQFWLARWEAISGGTATTILGPTLLSAEELATWFNANRRRPHTTVPIEELTRFYVEESVGTRVRADIAFAQSLLETGSFSYPAGGQVRGTDNNFAGMGACDSCNGGNRFPDARTGVRAQLQQLRVYADPTLTNASLDPPPVNAKLDRHHLKGEVPTWGGLTGTWATAKTYGDRILQIYAQILAWLTDRADL